MAQLSEILTQEKHRIKDEQMREIYLYAEGSFFRAYEWSAWLCIRYIYKFSVTKRMVKSVEEPMVFVGFPITSLTKFTPEGASCEHREEKLVVITLPEMVFPEGEDVRIRLQQDFENWKQCIPLKESKDHGKNGKSANEDVETNAIAHPRLTTVMQRIMSFPIEKKSPIECMLFLADIKEQIAEII